jgi:galactokinase
MAVRRRNDGVFSLRSQNFIGYPVKFSVKDLRYKKEDGWGNYPTGMIKELLAQGIAMDGAEIYYSGNIPNGAGLSSSASIGMVTGFGLTAIYNVFFEIEKLAKLSQRMENDFIGVNTGMMDQFAVAFGRRDDAIFLNCQTLKKEEVPLRLGKYRIVITNTNKRRGLTDSKYNERRYECEEGLKLLQKFKPELTELGDLSVDEFNRLKTYVSDPVFLRRIRHVVTENQRVILAKNVLKRGDLEIFGKLMEQSHESLRDDYEVSGKELDVLFDTQKNIKGCIGTRMTGAGFGGCTVSIVDSSKIEAFEEEVKKTYEKETQLSPTFYVCEIGDGVKELKKVVV